MLGVGQLVVRAEQFLDQQRPLAGIAVGHERLHPRGVGEQADEVEAHAADERPVVAPWRPGDSLRLPEGVDHAVDRIGAAVDGRRQIDRPQRQGRLPGRALEGETGFPGGLFVDPAPEHGDRLGRQRVAITGHPFVGVGAHDPGDELAPAGVPGEDPGLPRVAAGEEVVAGVEREPSLAGGTGVALTAVLHQEWCDVVREVDGP